MASPQSPVDGRWFRWLRRRIGSRIAYTGEGESTPARGAGVMATCVETDDRPRTLLSWSSGKDSAWALHVLRQQRQIEVIGLLTTVNGRVAMHAVRQDLLEAQARATGLPLWPVPIPSPCTNADYEVAFGDLFLEDIRRYRADRFASAGLTPLFPLWGLSTPDLAWDMMRGGLRAQGTCVDPHHLSPQFAGRAFAAAFLDDFPPHGRSLRRAGRVPYVRLCRPHVRSANLCTGRGGCGARWLRLRRSASTPCRIHLRARPNAARRNGHGATPPCHPRSKREMIDPLICTLRADSR